MTLAFSACGLPPPAPGAIFVASGLSLREAIRTLLPPEKRHLCSRVAQRYALAMMEMCGTRDFGEPLFPGIREALQAVEARGWLLALATGKSRRSAIAILDAHGLRPRFVSVQTADTAAAKPAPDMLLNAMAEAGAESEITVMVGDSRFDMAMAKNAGVHGIGVGWGYETVDELVAAGAEAVVPTAEALAPLLDVVVSGR